MASVVGDVEPWVNISLNPVEPNKAQRALRTRPRNVQPRGRNMVLPAAAAAPTEGIGFSELVTRLRTERPTRLDAIVNTAQHVALQASEFEGKPDVGMFFMTPEIPQLEGSVARMTNYMHRQLASSTGIPKPYYDRMRAERPDLLVQNVETWWSAEPANRMARLVSDVQVVNGVATLGGLKGRAWVSDFYHPLDNLDFVTAVLEEAEKHGARIHTCHLDDERVYLKLLSERMRIEVGRYGIMEAGVIVRNSEVGDGQVVVQPYFLQRWCSNGAVREEKFGQRHIGQKNDEGVLRHDTLQKKSEAVWMEVRDWVTAALSGHFLEKQANDLLAADGNRLAVPARLAVANLARRCSLSGEDGAGVLERYLRANNDTQFALVNALTEYAHTSGLDYRRQVELEAFGGTLISQRPAEFSLMVAQPQTEEQMTRHLSPN